MKGPARVQAAKQWIPTYTGKNLVRGYSRHFGVDLLCAVAELEILGYEVTLEYKEQLKKEFENRQKQADEKMLNVPLEEDDQFYFIAGYTSGGAPYGLTWDEICDNDDELLEYAIDDDLDDMPF